MSQKNDFKAFSISNNANVVSQRLYEESKDLLTGFPPNDVPTHLLNKALRQSSTISSVLADFISTQSGEDVLDDGDIAKLTAQLNRALEQKTTTKVPDASLTQKGVVQLTDVVGNSNTLTATQKLVSDVNDNANNRLAKTQNGADIPNKNEFVKNLGLGEGSTLPVGVPVPYPLATPPTGWLKCNGAKFDKAAYPALASVFSSGQLPDLRGEFIRGWDDERGVDSRRSLLSIQADDFKSHNHYFERTWGQRGFDPTSGSFPVSADTRGSIINHRSIDTNSVGGAETRPRNVAFNYIVRAV
ncbi:tail fiber protein [Photorhabdus sp. RM96S]|uniref:tail fiber protein n=1 Tax=Photorhabdus sp. RM96S TaxID=3342822 RepID=UPI0036D8300C